MRGMAGNAAALAASCRNLRRGNSMTSLHALCRGHAIQPCPAAKDYTCLVRRWKGQGLRHRLSSDLDQRCNVAVAKVDSIDACGHRRAGHATYSILAIPALLMIS